MKVRYSKQETQFQISERKQVLARLDGINAEVLNSFMITAILKFTS
jgi:hypothetical protein